MKQQAVAEDLEVERLI